MSGTTPHSAALRDLLDSNVPGVSVSFTDDPAAVDPRDAVSRGMDVAELRIDRFASHAVDHVVEVVRRFAGIPTIATIRSAAEGGDWSGVDAQRRELFDAVLPHVDAIDVELSSTGMLEEVIAPAHDAGRLAIVSHHDFDATPPSRQLRDVLERAEANDADLVKIATMVQSERDLQRLASFTIDHHDRRLIVIGMGPLGTPSRLLFPFLGSRLTFASAGRPSAPGQLPLTQMAEMFRTLSPDYAARHPER